jgi:hypothetical protein
MMVYKCGLPDEDGGFGTVAVALLDVTGLTVLFTVMVVTVGRAIGY